MKKKNFSKMFAVAAIAAASVSNSFAQTNIGQDCGCPPFNLRPVVDLGLAPNSITSGANEGDLIATNTVLTCDKTYLLSKKIYVPDGKTITINPGTVILGKDVGGVGGQASALVVTRGAKIIAAGTATCPIVFTAELDPMNGTYPISERGRWGGLVILGKATNNITAANNVAGGLWGGAPGVAFVEGYTAAEARNLHGMPVGQADDNDNSGIIRYVSVRHSGDIIVAGNELNGITLGSVGRGTTIDHVEVVSCDDDAFEMFGGTVNLKYCSVLYSADDMYDWDLGWSGKAQFLFGLKAPEATTPTADNGFEADADDQKTSALPRSHPQIYNATLIGNVDVSTVGDNSGIAAIKAKELTEGEIFNCVFANWRNGFDLIKAPGSRALGIESYANWTGGSLLVGCNTFVNNIQNANTIANSTAAILPADNTKFATDGNVSVPSVAGIDYTFNINTTTNALIDSYNAVPTTNIATTCTTPANDGFFTPATYRGAFKAGTKSWLADWSYLNLVPATQGLVPCPTDCNLDGKTDNADFLQLLGEFGQNCD